MDRIDRIVKGYRHGFYTLVESLAAIVSEANETNASDIIRRLSPDLFTELRKKVDESPPTEDGWNQGIFIHGGIRMNEESANERELRVARQRQLYRNGIESLRRLFAADQGLRTTQE